jgi:phosphoribosylglycinamide formyltransferase-1
MPVNIGPLDLNRVKHIAIFASGTGSNARRIMEYFQQSEDIRVVLVVSNKADAPVLETAASFGVETIVVQRQAFFQDNSLLDSLRNRSIDFIVLAGFLWLIPTYLVRAFSGKMINIHPALLPKFGGKGMYGMQVHRAVFAAKETQSGITIHYVDEHYDEGQIVFQTTCDISPNDSPDDIARKVLALEHRHLPPVVEQLLRAQRVIGA